MTEFHFLVTFSARVKADDEASAQDLLDQLLPSEVFIDSDTGRLAEVLGRDVEFV